MILAFTPLIDPLTALFPHMDSFWLWLVVPLVIAISIIYKGTRMENLRKLPSHVFIMSFQILIVMIAAAILLDLFYSLMTHAA
ncbi:MAG TPA: hypothetical protein VH253_07035 [Phycisphaerae bacterium]|nr:hypothetical protein [Phycisphaerae bacterium]